MKSRKLLAITGAAVITLTGGAAAATGNLMAPPPKDPPKTETVDAGTATPLTKKEAKDSKKGEAKKEPAKQ